MESKNRLARLLARPELPYILSALCLTLLIKHGYDNSSVSFEDTSASSQLVTQRSLQDVKEKCYQEQHVPVQYERCEGNCDSRSSLREDASDFSWSILTCGKTAGFSRPEAPDNVLQDFAMEVIGTGKMF